MNQTVRTALFDIFQDCFNLMSVPLTNYAVFSEELSRLVKVKAGENEQFSFDVELDQRIKQALAAHGISGRVFSEESGWFDIPGEQRYRVIYDPFCNSSLASRTFREGAIGLSVFAYDDYTFIASGILDFQTGIAGLVEDGETHFYQIQTGQQLPLGPSKISRLEDAWTVLTLEDPKERACLADTGTIMQAAKRVISSSGHIYWLKLAAGFIDAYADPFGGEALYEMFACTVAQYAGCTVSDRNNQPFNPSEYLKMFEQDQNARFYPISAGAPELHAAILQSLTART